MKLRRLALLAGAAVVAPVVIGSPRPRRAAAGEASTLDELVAEARQTGLSGWGLVDHLTQAVHQRYQHASVWHLWEPPATSFRNGRGCSNQYNSALASVLRRCGFEARLVHAARVRMDRAPWWNSGHTWVRVRHEGRERDVCAAKASNRAGSVGFVPMTYVRPFRTITYVDTTLGLAPFVVTSVWRSWLNREPVQRWVYRPFGETVTPRRSDD